MFSFVMDGRDLGRGAVRTFSCGCRIRSARIDVDEKETYKDGKKVSCIEFERHCSLGCGTRLSIYNMSDVCYVCQERMSQRWKKDNWRWGEE